MHLVLALAQGQQAVGPEVLADSIAVCLRQTLDHMAEKKLSSRGSIVGQ